MEHAVSKRLDKDVGMTVLSTEKWEKSPVKKEFKVSDKTEKEIFEHYRHSPTAPVSSQLG